MTAAIFALLLVYLGSCDFTPSLVIPMVSVEACERARIAIGNDPIVAREAGQVICLDIVAEELYPVRQLVSCETYACCP